MMGCNITWVVYNSHCLYQAMSLVFLVHLATAKALTLVVVQHTNVQECIIILIIKIFLFHLLVNLFLRRLDITQNINLFQVKITKTFASPWNSIPLEYW